MCAMKKALERKKLFGNNVVAFISALALTGLVVGCVSSRSKNEVLKQVPEEGTVSQMETFGAIDSIDTPHVQKESFENKVIDKRFEGEMEFSPFAESKPKKELIFIHKNSEAKKKNWYKRE
jgi:hypothetical protein